MPANLENSAVATRVTGTKWEYLPKGAYFSANTVLPLEVKDVTDEDGLLTAGTHDIHAVIFTDSGRAAEKKAFEVVVREGVVTDNETVTRNNNAANQLTAKVNKYTGGIRTE